MGPPHISLASYSKECSISIDAGQKYMYVSGPLPDTVPNIKQPTVHQYIEKIHNKRCLVFAN